jgi:Tfp pilus assembly protein PilO
VSPKVRRTILIGALIIVAVSAAGWQFLLSPRLDQAAMINAEAEQVETATLSTMAKYTDLRRKAEELPAAAQEAKVLFASMPREADLPEFLNQITKAAEKSGIPPQDITTLSTGLPTPIDSGDNPVVQLGTMSLSITVKGSLVEFRRFLDALVELDRSILVTSTNVTISQDDAQASQMSVQGTMFVMQSPLDDLLTQVEELVAELDAS